MSTEIEQGPFAGYQVIECGDHFHVVNVNDDRDYGSFDEPLEALRHIMYLLYGMPTDLRGEEILDWMNDYQDRVVH